MTKSLIEVVGEDVKLQKLVQRDEFLMVVNSEPPKNWIKMHPIASGVKYLPIEKIELLLTRIFQEWHVEIKREGQLANSVYVTVRLHYKDPIEGVFRWQEGTGAAPIKTRKGEDASNMAAILNDAIMTGLPAAESYAIKDAAEKIGKLFGKDLNRKDVMGFAPSYATEEGLTKVKEQKAALRKKLDADN